MTSPVSPVTFWSGVSHRILLAVHGPRPVARDEWQAYVESVERGGYDGTLVVVDNGCPVPDAKQRSDLAAAWKRMGRTMPVSVVVQSAIHRGSVKVMGWLSKDMVILGFHPSRFDEALTHAGVTAVARAAVLDKLLTVAEGLQSDQIQQLARASAASGR